MESSKKGFSLVELIAVLVILGLVGMAGTLGFTDAIRGYVFATDNIELAEKAMVTLNRLSTELTHLAYNPPVNHALHDSAKSVGYEVTASGSSNITFNTSYGQLRGTDTVAINFTNGQITINGNVLCDNVTSFSLQYLPTYNGTPAGSFDSLATRIVGITLVLTGANGVSQTFTTNVVPKFPF